MDQKIRDVLSDLRNRNKLDMEQCHSILREKNSVKRFKEFEKMIFGSGRKGVEIFLDAWSNTYEKRKFFYFYLYFLNINLN